MSVLVIGGFQNGTLGKQTLEAISASLLLGEEVSLLLYTKDEPEKVGSMFKDFGIARIYVFPLKGDYQLSWEEVLEVGTGILIEDFQVILLTADSYGGALGPRIAYKTKAGIVSDCTGIRKEEPGIFLDKAVFGSKALATYRVESFPLVVTIKPGCFEQYCPNGNSTEINIIENKWCSNFKLIETRGDLEGEVKLEDAEVIIGGGRGIGGGEQFQLLSKLAKLMGGSVGASRASVDAGWIGSSRQIGLTGKSVQPNVYIAVGISGASQHMAGLSNAKNIVAINSDPDAPIFDYSTLGIVADSNKLLPLLLEKINKIT